MKKLHLYNSLGGEKQLFTPRKFRAVSMYTCGPTVYDYIQVGNIRAFLAADLLRRVLVLNGYKVRQVKNITDIGHMVGDADSGEDKVIAKAKKEGTTPEEIAKHYTDAFLADEKKLDILPAYKNPRASENVPQMIAIIKALIKRGHAYESNGSVYFDVTTFPTYGALSGNTVAALRKMVRGKLKKEKFAEKKNPEDFVLWVKAAPNHLLKWKSPWSLGYPGWHIECSAMSARYLRQPIDIHTGGPDNKFPHHENERAQTEGATGKPFVRYWVHAGQLSINGKKMSKSLGNSYTLADIEKMGFPPSELRLALLSAHYRSPMDFSIRALEQARESLQRIIEFHDFLATTAATRKKSDINSTRHLENFIAALQDDLDTPQALAAVFAAISETYEHRTALAPADLKSLATLLKEFSNIFGISLERPVGTDEKSEIEALVQKRETARAARDFATADALRDQLDKMGVILKDTSQGPTWRKK